MSSVLNVRERHRQSGFSLIEAMITLAVVAILVAVALPTYTNQQTSARRSDCQAALISFAQAMEKHYALTFSYLGAAVNEDDTGAPAATLHPDTCPATGQAFYNLSIQEATVNSFTLRAVPVSGTGQAADGRLEINSLGQRFWDRNNDQDTSDAGENNWDK